VVVKVIVAHDLGLFAMMTGLASERESREAVGCLGGPCLGRLARPGGKEPRTMPPRLGARGTFQALFEDVGPRTKTFERNGGGPCTEQGAAPASGRKVILERCDRRKTECAWSHQECQSA
jgi:hypothetical protein